MLALLLLASAAPAAQAACKQMCAACTKSDCCADGCRCVPNEMGPARRDQGGPLAICMCDGKDLRDCLKQNFQAMVVAQAKAKAEAAAQASAAGTSSGR